jgi:hypothetical protein
MYVPNENIKSTIKVHSCIFESEMKIGILKKNIFVKLKQLGMALTKMLWLLGR